MPALREAINGANGPAADVSSLLAGIASSRIYRFYGIHPLSARAAGVAMWTTLGLSLIWMALTAAVPANHDSMSERIGHVLGSGAWFFVFVNAFGWQGALLLWRLSGRRRGGAALGFILAVVLLVIGVVLYSIRQAKNGLAVQLEFRKATAQLLADLQHARSGGDGMIPVGSGPESQDNGDQPAQDVRRCDEVVRQLANDMTRARREYEASIKALDLEQLFDAEILVNPDTLAWANVQRTRAKHARFWYEHETTNCFDMALVHLHEANLPSALQSQFEASLAKAQLWTIQQLKEIVALDRERIDILMDSARFVHDRLDRVDVIDQRLHFQSPEDSHEYARFAQKLDRNSHQRSQWLSKQQSAYEQAIRELANGSQL